MRSGCIYVIAALLVGALNCVGGNAPVVQNQASAKWSHDAGDPPGAESIVLREDSATGAIEMFVRYPSGHVFQPHWHNANERILLMEGKLAVQAGGSATKLESVGNAV